MRVLPRVRHGIAIVASRRQTRMRLLRWFDTANYDTASAGTFAEGKRLLAAAPDLLVAEVKLGEYNGLHLATIARSLGVPTILIGPSDVVLERDADQIDALYLHSVRRQDLLDVVALELALMPPDVGPPGVTGVLAPARPMLQHPMPGRCLLCN
jgi:hypothetical protein